MGKVLVVGSLNMDVTTFVDKMPARGETTRGNGFLISPGGKGANQAVAASRMGAEVQMLGGVGKDTFGYALIDALKTSNVNTNLVHIDESAQTGMASIIVVSGDNRIILYGGANAEVTSAQIERAADQFKACDCVVLQLEIPLEAVMTAARMAKKYGKCLIVNPAPAQIIPNELFELSDYFVPNETEAGQLLGRKLDTDADMLGALHELRGKGVKHPVITLGDRGAALYSQGKPYVQCAHLVKAIDTTAAGDTFIGALAAQISDGSDLDGAMELAMRAAAICVTKKGAQMTIPTREEALNWHPSSARR